TRRLDAGVKLATMLSHRADDGDKKPDRREERGISVKAIAQGMPACFGVPVVTLLVCFFVFAREAMGATCIRHSLRPLISEGQCLARLGRFLCRENAGVH